MSIDNDTDVTLQQELDMLRASMNSLKQKDENLYYRLNDVFSYAARTLEEDRGAIEGHRDDASEYTTQARQARDKAEIVARFAASEAERAVAARERALRAANESEADAKAFAEASASATATSHILTGPGSGSPPIGCAPQEAPRPADPLVSTMGQLSTLLIGSSPAFANAMRLQTDAVASGMGNLNAIANQQAHYTLDLAATARAVAETYSANKKSDMYFYLPINEAAPAPAPATTATQAKK